MVYVYVCVYFYCSFKSMYCALTEVNNYCTLVVSLPPTRLRRITYKYVTFLHVRYNGYMHVITRSVHRINDTRST